MFANISDLNEGSNKELVTGCSGYELYCSYFQFLVVAWMGLFL